MQRDCLGEDGLEDFTQERECGGRGEDIEEDVCGGGDVLSEAFGAWEGAEASVCAEGLDEALDGGIGEEGEGFGTPRDAGGVVV